MRRLVRIHAVACAALILPAFAAADVSFTAQEREVATHSHSALGLWQQGSNPMSSDPTAAYTANDDHGTAAPDFAPFSATVTSTAPPVVGPAVREGSASASQTSSLQPQAITASADVSASGDAFFLDSSVIAALNALLLPPVPYFFGYMSGNESAGSQLTVEFELSEPTPYHLTGSLVAGPGFVGFPSQFFSSSASVQLDGPSGTVESDQAFSCGCEHELDRAGILAPGSYTLLLSAGSHVAPFCDFVSCNAYATHASFDVNLSLAGVAVVPGPSRGMLALLGLALAALGAAALRRA
jgi:hypothetical protein